MNVLNFINAFFSDSAHWHGYDGIPTGCWSTSSTPLEALAIAAAIGLPVGLITGHYGRGGNALALIATAGRALPTFGLLVLMFVSLGLRHAARDDPAGRARRPADPGHHLRGDALRRPVAGGRRPGHGHAPSRRSCSRSNCPSRCR